MSKAMRTFITISVLLNLLLLGVISGHAGKSLFGCKPASRHLNLHELVAVLPEQRQQELGQTIAQFDHDIAGQREQLIEERKKAAQLLAADPFDRTAYAAQVDVVQKLRSDITRNIEDALSRIASQCTPEERKKLADKLIERQNQINKE